VEKSVNPPSSRALIEVKAPAHLRRSAEAMSTWRSLSAAGMFRAQRAGQRKPDQSMEILNAEIRRPGRAPFTWYDTTCG